jgi:acetyl esterase/lipase
MLVACSTSAGSRSGDTAVSSAEVEAVPVVHRCAPEPAAATALRIARDVTYAARDGETLELDVAWSPAGPAAPLVVLLHGGGWSGGSRSSFDGEMQALARRGYTAATVEYRLTQAPRNVFPAALVDVRCAVRALRRRAAEFHIAPDHVAIMGYSAGGHLASLLGTGAPPGASDADGSEAGDTNARVQAVVSYAGPQDLRVDGPYTREQAELVTNFLGVFPGDAPDVARRASPIAHVRRGAPPFLLLHGSDDPLVPITHPRRMRDALRTVIDFLTQRLGKPDGASSALDRSSARQERQ